MNKEEILKESEGIVFENDRPVKEDMISVREAALAEDKNTLSEFYSPLFRGKLSKSTIHWLVFLVVSFSCTGTLLFFIYSFAQEMSSYQSSAALGVRQRSAYETTDQTVVPVSNEQINKIRAN
jgi:hypothetical protein